MAMLYIDFETRSHSDLTVVGAYTYASCRTTEVLCIGWWLDEDRQGCVDTFDELPDYVIDYVQNTDGLIAAWNAQFDRLIWQFQAPEHLQVPRHRWYCLSATARVNALPAGLNDCAKAVFGKYKKDVRGAQLIKRMSLPPFEDTPALRQQMREYCLQDVLVSVDLAHAMRVMSATEHRDYVNSELVNDDGIEIDTYLAAKAVQYAEAEKEALSERVRTLTGNAIQKLSQVQAVRQWCGPRLTEDQTAAITTDGKMSLDKKARARLLDFSDLDPGVREVVEILDEGNKSSVAKFQRMLDRADPRDRRVRGAFLYAGASQTLRFASRGLQLHNFARDCLPADEVEDLIDLMEQGKPVPDCMRTLSKALRGALVPSKGNAFIVGDWKGIEACALPWLADHKDARNRLNTLANPNKDIYVETQHAMGLADRQMGKVVELAMGYGGGVGALNSMAGMYGLEPMSDYEGGRLVTQWRTLNTWAEDFWNSLDNAAKSAMRDPLNQYEAGRVSYCFYPDLLGGTLVCTLPNNTLIQYPKAELTGWETPSGWRSEITALKANWKPAAGEKTWPRVTLWRGLLAENVTQAFCAALLRDCIDRLLDRSWPVVAHVHDEIVVEVDEEFVTQDVADVRSVMEEVPEWAEGLPLIADVKSMVRYGK